MQRATLTALLLAGCAAPPPPAAVTLSTNEPGRWTADAAAEPDEGRIADFLVSQPSLDPRLGAGGTAPVLGRGTRPVAMARGPATVDAVGMFPIDGSESRAWGGKTITRYSWQLLT